jgi:DNA-binding transcriptional MerR regulator
MKPHKGSNIYNFYTTIMENINDLDKKFYKISEVAEILNVPASTLRFWEKEFTIIKPRRNDKNTRFYTPRDVETIRLVYYLVKEKGLKLDAAQAEIRRNRDNVNKNFEVIERLRGMKEHLLKLQKALESMR